MALEIAISVQLVSLLVAFALGKHLGSKCCDRTDSSST